jgi:8-oxo-dGTP pyrophosphatase MutT (NUDIX family)
MDDLIDVLTHKLKAPLPGPDAQYRMAHGLRRNYPTPTGGGRPAGVLALLYPFLEDWAIVLIQRPSHNPNDRHSGQISLPGGKYEEADGNLQTTALRETEEETGVLAADVTIMGALTPLYIPVSNFMVSPYVGVIGYRPEFIPQAGEVAAIIEAPIGQFTDSGNRKFKDMTPQPGMTLQGVPYFDIGGQVVWGATAMILSELVHLVE